MHTARRTCLRAICLIFLAAFSPGQAAMSSWWQVGLDDSPHSPNYNATAEFGAENNQNDAAPGRVTRRPEDPLYLPASNPGPDDDFYLAGTYPAGFNRLAAALQVPVAEPTTAFERAFTTGDRTNRIHFILSAAQSSATARLRLSLELLWGGVWIGPPVNASGDGFGTHDITLRWRTGTSNVLLWEGRLTQEQRINVEFPASLARAIAGANTLEIARTGPDAANTSSWIQCDFVRLEGDPDALRDEDQDGLPRWWEEETGLSDSNPADATADHDGDRLSALEEYDGGLKPTDPNQADTDRDGLSDDVERWVGSDPLVADTDGDLLGDGLEMAGPLLSSPIHGDSDNDLAPDALERRVGTNPLDPLHRPTVFRGGVGLHFVTLNDPQGVLTSNTPAGVVPQLFWNETKALIPWNQPSGRLADVAAPVSGRLVRSDGAVVSGMNVAWTSADAGSTYNRTSPDGRLLNGFLHTQAGRTPVELTVSGVPFARYDLYVYVGGPYRDQSGILSLVGVPGSEHLFRSMSTPPQTRFLEVRRGDTNRVDGTFIRYRGLSLPTLTLRLEGLNGSVGIHAFQFIDTTLDSDGSGIPDWYELQYRLEPGTAALAASDSDGDGLNNLEEYRRESDPWVTDTDGDGLSDRQEAAERVANADSDGDGLSDTAEQTGVLPSDPGLADSDGDGWGDGEEARHHTDPSLDERTLSDFAGWLPARRDAPTRLEWTLANVQIVWDHTSGSLGGALWNEEPLLTVGVANALSRERESIRIQLRQSAGALTYLFTSDPNGAFSGSASPGNGIWFTESTYPPLDLKPLLGFSGFGSADISDRLKFHLLAVRESANSWTLTFEIINQTTSVVVASRSFQQCTAANDVDAGTAVWMNFDRTELWPAVEVHPGAKVFLTPKPLETLPAFAASRDGDGDGMPDSYETAHGLNPRSSADAMNDLDADGVANRDEWIAGTDPQRADTDQDGMNDRVELFYRSNALDPAIRPALAGLAWPTGEDLDGDGLSDIWQARFQAFGMQPGADADEDGVANAQEAATGTDPRDPASRALLQMRLDQDDVVLSWPRIPGKNQDVLVSTNLRTWTVLNEAVSTDGVRTSMRLAGRVGAKPIEYFRLGTGDLDLDGDGLSDWAEGFLGSDPFGSDSMGQATPRVDPSGRIAGTVSGDYAAFVQRFAPPAAGLTRVQAARLLQQATFGPTPLELDRLQALGVDAWLEDQFQRTPTLHQGYIETIQRDLRGPRIDLTYGYNPDGNYILGNNGQTAFARAAVAGADQLRQRVAFALSQILVISRRDPNLENRPLSMANYYDIFVKNAFGNYEDILRAVTLHPLMGRYLSHIGNQKARPEINQYPDENYAREVMQLFTIGLWELNPDGTQRLDARGLPIPTYGTREITELARVFTGLWFGGQQWGWNGWSDEESTIPMDLWPATHDFGSKTLVRGSRIPSRAATAANGMRDIDDALRVLFEHPNTAPFVSRQLIQFLVTSNPSREYVGRVAARFADNGSGRRGDLGSVVRAVLTDPEARDARAGESNPGFGRLKEPVHRAMAIARLGQLDRYDKLLWWDYGNFYNETLQAPGQSPSVFNFFRPHYSPPGVLAKAGLVAPTFQITQSTTCISLPNHLWRLTTDGLRLWGAYQFPPDYSPLLPLATRPGALIDELNLMFCAGQMTAATRAAILDAVQQVTPTDPLGRVRLAIYLAAVCPEGAVQR
jgi:uncharacterized protein (DUF1800 family)